MHASRRISGYRKGGTQARHLVHDFRNPNFPSYGFHTYDIGPYRWETIETSIHAIYCAGGWRHWYNDRAAGAKRGIVYIAPTDKPLTTSTG
jgi:hypothetical protein